MPLPSSSTYPGEAAIPGYMRPTGIAAEFGDVIVETDVDSAVVGTLRLWLPTYLAQIERERDLGLHALARPVDGSYANTLEDDEFPDHRLPAIIVTTASTSAEPDIDGAGRYYAAWRVVVSAVVRGRTPQETRGLAALFGGSVRRILVQQPSLGGLAAQTRWIAGNVAPVADPTGAGRYLAAGINQFTVYVDDVIDADAGPRYPEPDDSPYDDPDPTGTPDAPYDPLTTVSNVTTRVVGTPITASPGS